MTRAKAFFVVVAIGQVLSLNGCKTVSRAVDNGGTIFVVEVIAGENVDVPDKIGRSVNVLQTRLDAIGIDGEVVRAGTGDDRLEVRVYGSPDLTRLRDFLFKTYQLEFRKVVTPPFPSPVQTYPSEDAARSATAAEQEFLPYKERDGSVVSQFAILEKALIITGEDIRSAEAVSYTGSDLDYEISFTLKQEGSEKFGFWTERNINNYLGVVLDGTVVSVVFIKTRILDAGVISGRFSKSQAEDLSLGLRSGYMPWELRVVEERKF